MRRPYFFELFVLANLALVALVAHRSWRLIERPLAVAGGLFFAILVQALLGVAVRAAVGAVRRDRTYLRRVRTRRWLIDTLRLAAGGALMVFTYGWLKLVVPLYHPRLFDQELWDLDQILFFGLSPTVLFLDLFDSGGFLRAIDWAYVNVFYASTFVATVYFLSEPRRRIRVAFANGNTALWLAGAWLYLAIPSVGPAYRFPDLWFPHAEALQLTQVLQAALMRNWQDVQRAAMGEAHGPIVIAFGIGAFPSLHVAFQTFVFFWMRRLWTSGEVLFGFFALVILLGSMITGWHYLVDGLAGILMAWAAYRLAWRSARMDRFLELHRR